MLNLALAAFPERANGDGELRIAARLWTGVLRFDVGERMYSFPFEGGRLAEVMAGAAGENPVRPYTVRVSAPEEDWRELLAPVPRPFYQDLYGAISRHGFAVDGDFETFFAYYPAVRRLIELLRIEVAAGEP